MQNTWIPQNNLLQLNKYKKVMKYARQTQDALDRLDSSLRTLRNLIQKGQNKEAIEYMENGDLKERFGDLQNMIILSQTNNLGASGTTSVGTL